MKSIIRLPQVCELGPNVFFFFSHPSPLSWQSHPQGRSKCLSKVKSGKSRIAHQNAKIVECSLLIYFFLLPFLSAPRSEKREVAAENPPPPQSRWRRRPYLGNCSADFNKNWTHHCGRITPRPPTPSAPLPFHRYMEVGAVWLGGASSINRFKFRQNRPGVCRDMGDGGWGHGDDNDNNKWITEVWWHHVFIYVSYLTYGILFRE